MKVYDNALLSLKSVNCKNRELYVGKCLAVEEILNIEKIIEKIK